MPWLFDQNGKQVTPSVVGQPIEHGQAKHNNARRFKELTERNERLHADDLKIILQPAEDRDSYTKFDDDSE